MCSRSVTYKEVFPLLGYHVPYSFETRLTNVSRMMVQCPPPKRKGYYMQSKHPVIEGAIHIDIVTNSQTELPFNLSVQLVRQYDLRLAKFKGCCCIKVGH